MTQENKATRPKKVPRKKLPTTTKKVADPLNVEDKALFNPPNKYAPRAKIGEDLKAKKVVTVGLGGLVVTTNGRDHYRQH